MQNIIYQIRNLIDNKLYIGLTSKGLDRRKYEHVRLLKKKEHPNRHLQKAWIKYGEENFLFEILIELESDRKLSEYEIQYIKKLKTYNPLYGYNLTFGGESEKPNAETIQKKIKSSKKVPVAQYDLDGNLIKIFQSVKSASRELNIPDTDIHRCCRFQYMKRKDFLFRKGCDIPDSIDAYDKFYKYRNIIVKVWQYSLDEKFIREWDSITEATKFYNCNRSSIGNACKRKKTAIGFIWRYENDKIENSI